MDVNTFSLTQPLKEALTRLLSATHRNKVYEVANRTDSSVFLLHKYLNAAKIYKHHEE